MLIDRQQETPAAAGQRYLITAGRFSALEFINWVCENQPERAKEKGLTKHTKGLYPATGTYTADNSKSIKDLGLTYRSLNEMLADLCWDTKKVSL